MNYSVAGNGLSISDEIRSYLEKRLAHLDKLMRGSGAARTEAHLSYRQSEEKTYCAKLLLHAPGVAEPMLAEARGEALHEAIDVAAAELTRELTKHKKKRVHVFKRTGVRVKEFLRGWRRRV